MVTKTLVIRRHEDGFGEYEESVVVPVDADGRLRVETLDTDGHRIYTLWQFDERHRQEIAHKYLGVPRPEPEPFDPDDDSAPF
jgi:hypothetical protein